MTSKPEDKFVLFDPPSGWRFGFPKLIKLGSTNEEIADFLRENGYPEKDIELALNHSRFIYLSSEDFEANK